MKLFVSCGAKSIKRHKIKSSQVQVQGGVSPRCLFYRTVKNPEIFRLQSRRVKKTRLADCVNMVERIMKNCASWLTGWLMRSAVVWVSIMLCWWHRKICCCPSTLFCHFVRIRSPFIHFFIKHSGVSHLSTTQDLLISAAAAASCSSIARYRQFIYRQTQMVPTVHPLLFHPLHNYDNTHTQPTHYKLTSWQTSY